MSPGEVARSRGPNQGQHEGQGDAQPVGVLQRGRVFPLFGDDARPDGALPGDQPRGAVRTGRCRRLRRTWVFRGNHLHRGDELVSTSRQGDDASVLARLLI